MQAKSNVSSEESPVWEWLAATIVLAGAAICALTQILIH